MASKNSQIPPNDKSESDAAVQDAILLGLRNAAIAGSIVAVPTLIGCRVIPWAKHNLNYTAQTLIISAAAVAGFYITADKTILRTARGNTIGKIDKEA